jgi:hypothetical protein
VSVLGLIVIAIGQALMGTDSVSDAQVDHRSTDAEPTAPRR